MKANFLKLTLVTNKENTPVDRYLEFAEACLKAQITCVQLREKSLEHDALLDFGRSLKALLDRYNVPLIVNDDVELCLELGAMGVHLGQSDTAVLEARSILGKNKVIGLTVNNIKQIQEANSLPIDYIGLGAIFPTQNKPNIETIWGIDGLQEASRISSHPIVAIGGIDTSNALSVIQAGAHGIAAIGAFHASQDPFETTTHLVNTIKEANHDS